MEKLNSNYNIYNLEDSEKIYVPWLVDLAYLEKNLIMADEYRMSYSLKIPLPDYSDAYSNGVAVSDLIIQLTITHSFLEKGLKYLLLLTSENIAYNDLKSSKKWGHDLTKLYNRLQENNIKLRNWITAKERGLLNMLLNLDFTKLRYLDYPQSISIRYQVLKGFICKIRDFIFIFRRDLILSNAEFCFRINKYNSESEIVKGFWKIQYDAPKKVPERDFQNIIQGKNYLRAFKNEKNQFEHFTDHRLSEEERKLIENSYYLKQNEYCLVENISLRHRINLFKFFRKVDFVFPRLDFPSLIIRNGEMKGVNGK